MWLVILKKTVFRSNIYVKTYSLQKIFFFFISFKYDLIWKKNDNFVKYLAKQNKKSYYYSLRIFDFIIQYLSVPKLLESCKSRVLNITLGFCCEFWGLHSLVFHDFSVVNFERLKKSYNFGVEFFSFACYSSKMYDRTP